MRFRSRKSGGLGTIYNDGEAIVRQGEVGDSMFVIQAGRVDVFTQTGEEESLLRRLGPGDFFGELALFDEQERSATVRAHGEARVLTLDKRTLLRRFHEDPSLAYRVVETLSHRVRELTRELTDARESTKSEHPGTTWRS